MPVDLYVGGAEHAVLHLLYARFWHKVLFDRGHVSTPEPFLKLVNQGMILGEMEFTGYRKEEGGWLSSADVRLDADNKPVERNTGRPAKPVRVEAADVEKQGDSFVLTADPSIRVDSRAYKMSKSRGNVVNPDEVVAEYGADALRLYRDVHGPAGSDQALEHEGRERRAGIFGSRVADDRRRAERNAGAQPGGARRRRRRPSKIACCTRRSTR